MKNLYRFAALMLGAIALGTAQAEEYPTHAIRLVVPFPAGSIADLTGRSIGQALAAELKQPVVVENRPGVTGSMASEAVTKAAPDGYTLLIGNDATHATNRMLYKSVNYDALRDFTPIAPAVDSALVMVVHKSVPAHSVEELVKLARSGAKLSFGSSGVGSPHHLAGEMLNQAAHIDLQHVPYKGGAPAVTDVVGGQIPILFASLGSVRQYFASGQIRPLAVLTKSRVADLPNVPTLSESYPGLEISGWTAFFGPPGISTDIVTKLNSAIRKSLADPQVATTLTAAGLSPTPGSPEALRSLVAREIARRTQIIQGTGIQRE